MRVKQPSSDPAKTFNCVSGCVQCCGVQPVTKTQLERIREALRAKPKPEIRRMKAQKRDRFTCPLLDVENARCFVYEQRPEVCRMFGYFEGLGCPHFPRFATGSRIAGHLRLEAANNGEETLGVLGIDFTWNKGL